MARFDFSPTKVLLGTLLALVLIVPQFLGCDSASAVDEGGGGSVRIVSIQEGAVLDDIRPVSIIVDAPITAEKVELRIDGLVAMSSRNSPHEFDIDLSAWADDDSHVIEAAAADSAGTVDRASINVTIYRLSDLFNGWVITGLQDASGDQSALLADYDQFALVVRESESASMLVWKHGDTPRLTEGSVVVDPTSHSISFNLSQEDGASAAFDASYQWEGRDVSDIELSIPETAATSLLGDVVTGVTKLSLTDGGDWQAFSTLIGRVLDQNNDPIDAAEVEILEFGTVRTDLEGAFSAFALVSSPTDIIIVARKEGYTQSQVVGNVSPGSTVNVPILRMTQSDEISG